MQYIISGRDIRITEAPEGETTLRKRAAAKARPRDAEGRFLARASNGKPREKWMRLFVLAKPVK